MHARRCCAASAGAAARKRHHTEPPCTTPITSRPSWLSMTGCFGARLLLVLPCFIGFARQAARWRAALRHVRSPRRSPSVMPDLSVPVRRWAPLLCVPLRRSPSPFRPRTCGPVHSDRPGACQPSRGARRMMARSSPVSPTMPALRTRP